MEISQYLVELITEKDQVIVPGLGKFSKKRKSGYYDDATKTYFPPSGEIVYSADYMHDDKLVHLISLKKGTSLTSAYAILDEYIREIKLALKSNVVKLRGIGTLSQNEGQMSLVSETETNLNKSFFGLPHVDTLSEKLVGVDTENYSLAEQALNASLSGELYDKQPKRGILAIVMGIIAVAILAGVVGLYFAKPGIYKDLVRQIQNYTVSNPSPTPVAPVAPKNQTPNAVAIQKADSIYSNNDIESKLKAEGFEVEKVKDSTNVSVKTKVLPKKGDIKYEIIIGLYTRREDAVKRVSQLKANGIDAHIVEDADGPMIKISCATLYSDAEANRELDRVREELNPEAFKKAIKILK